MARVALGQTVTLISAYDSDQRGQGTVTRLSPVIDATTGTFRVTIEVDSSSTKLRPGQFVEVKIEVERHENVLTVARPAVVYEDGLPVVFRMIDPPPPEEKKDEEGDEEKASGWLTSSVTKEPSESEEEKEEELPKMTERVA